MKNANNMYKHCKKLILEKIYLNADWKIIKILRHHFQDT